MSVTTKGNATPIDDIDLPRIGSTIGVGEDVLHAIIEVETTGSGFDSQGRVKLLFEPHKFYAHLKGAKRQQAVDEGLAYPKWGMKKYPRDSYPRLEQAIAIDETAALLSGSWGLGQIMGENFEMCDFATVQEMVSAFADREAVQLEAMIAFIKSAGIDDDLRRIEKISRLGKIPTAADWVPIVRVYNGPGYSKNNYHVRAANAYAKWLKIKDTPFSERPTIIQAAEAEELEAQAATLRGEGPIELVDDTNDDAAKPPVVAQLPAPAAVDIHDDPKPAAPVSATAVAPAQTGTVNLQTVNPSPLSSAKRMWTSLGIGTVGLGAYFTQAVGWLKDNEGVLKWVVIAAVAGVLLYLLSQLVYGMFDRWAAFQLNVHQIKAASDPTLNTVKLNPAETGQEGK